MFNHNYTLKYIFLFIGLKLLSSCAISSITYDIKSIPTAARIEVNGQSRCSKTPCNIQLICKAGQYGPRTEPAFIAAFPTESNNQLHPQYKVAEVCKKEQQTKPEEINFDLTQPQNGDFTQGSHVPFLLKKYFSASRGEYRTVQSDDQNYFLTVYQVSLGQLISSTESLKIWSSINIFEGQGESNTESNHGQPSGFGVSNIYQFHPTNMEMFYLSTGPFYMHQYHGNSSDTFALYGGAGFLLHDLLNLGSKYTGDKRFTTGDLKMDLALDLGYVLPITGWDRTYNKLDVSLRIYY